MDLLFCVPLVHVPNFEGVSGSEDRGGGDNSIQFINFGRVGHKSFKEWRQKIGGGGGGRVGDSNILTFFVLLYSIKMSLSCLFLHSFAYTLTKRTCILGNFVYSCL